jgi:phospholipid/cholesterol/gamma-HCH transport system ATP-binding protein
VSGPAVLRFEATRLVVDLAGLDALRIDAALAPGDIWLIDAETPEHDRALADAALGLTPPLDGTVRFRDHDWWRVPVAFRDALRGRCGLIPRETALVPYASMTENILAPRRYHDRTSDGDLVRQAAASARRFGLPGLPAGDPAEESAADRLRAACVRAFLGEPLLVVVESRSQPWRRELVAPLVASMQEVRDRGGAVLWSLVEDPLVEDPAIPATGRFRLRGSHLEAVAG